MQAAALRLRVRAKRRIDLERRKTKLRFCWTLNSILLLYAWKQGFRCISDFHSIMQENCLKKICFQFRCKKVQCIVIFRLHVSVALFALIGEHKWLLALGSLILLINLLQIYLSSIFYVWACKFSSAVTEFHWGYAASISSLSWNSHNLFPKVARLWIAKKKEKQERKKDEIR